MWTVKMKKSVFDTKHYFVQKNRKVIFTNLYTDIVCFFFLPNLCYPKKDLDAPLQKWFKMGLWEKNYVEVEY